jgi:hypothetical protein
MGLKLDYNAEFKRPSYLRIKEEFWIGEAGLEDWIDDVEASG